MLTEKWYVHACPYHLLYCFPNAVAWLRAIFKDHVLVIGNEALNLISSSGVVAAHGNILSGVPTGTIRIGDWDNDGDNDLIVVTHDSYACL